MSDTETGTSRWGRLVPFSWEIIWFSAGALSTAASKEWSLAFVGVLLFGGFIGSWAYQRQQSKEVTRIAS